MPILSSCLIEIIKITSLIPGSTIPLMTVNSDHQFGKNWACFRNDQCSSGFCKRGQCADPHSLHDPCRAILRNCPGTLRCSEFSRTCVSEHFSPSRASSSSCRTVSDCRFNELCLDGTCKPSRSIGSSCESVSPDLCAMGSKCTVSKSISEHTKCHELCSGTVACPQGFQCTTNLWNSDAVCVRTLSPNIQQSSRSQAHFHEIIYGLLLILTALLIFLGLIYGWIKFTSRQEDDPRLMNSATGKKKKKKFKLCHDGNGLATITAIPSNCQSPQPQPVAAAQLFVNPYNTNIYSDAPPEYSEAITIR